MFLVEWKIIIKSRQEECGDFEWKQWMAAISCELIKIKKRQEANKRFWGLEMNGQTYASASQSGAIVRIPFEDEGEMRSGGCGRGATARWSGGWASGRRSCLPAQLDVQCQVVRMQFALVFIARHVAHLQSTWSFIHCSLVSIPFIVCLFCLPKLHCIFFIVQILFI